MNKIFSKVWNRKLGQLVVASEHARSGGAKVGGGGAKAVALLAVLGGSLLLLSTAGAAPITAPIQAQSGTKTADAIATTTDTTAAGAGSSATYAGATAYGAGSTASGGANTVIGFNATAAGNVWAIGNLGNRRTDGLGMNITSSTALAASVAVGAGANTGAQTGTALGSYATTGGVGAIAVGAHSNAAGRNAIAQGSAAYASGLQSTAIGSFSAATVDRAIAIGTTSTASGVDANAIGTSATASGDRAIALGSARTATLNTDTQQNTTDNTQATGTDAIAIGTSTQAVSSNAIAMGTSSYSDGNASIAIGSGSLVRATGASGYGIAIGKDASTSGSIVVGNGATASINGLKVSSTMAAADAVNYAVVVGEGAIAKSNQALALGYKATVDGVGGMALGTSSAATSTGAVALGQSSIANGIDATASGARSTAMNTGATAYGAESLAWGNNSVAIGFQSRVGTDVAGLATWNIAGRGNRRTDGLGVDIVDGVTQNASNVALGANSSVTGAGGTALGGYASASAIGGAALGVHSTAAARNALAAGTAAYAGGTQSLAIGSFSAATVERANAIGAASTANGTDANAIGTSATASGTRAIALGSARTATLNLDALQNTTDNTQATGTDSIAIGTDSRATATNAVSVGASSWASADNSVALGAGSTTTADLTAAGYNPGSSVLAGTASAANGEVSVGAAGAERRLTNVAAGSAATDAVNVSQLQSEAVKSANIGTSTAAALGGGASYGADGTLGAPSYSVGGTTYNNVGSAITGLDGRVTTNATNITTNTGDINNLKTGKAGLVQQSAAGASLTVGKDTDGAAVSVAGTAGSRTVTGVTAGSLSALSTDAVNGSQLFATNARLGTAENSISTLQTTVAGNTTSINTLQTTVEGHTTSITNLTQSLADGEVGLVKQDATSKRITVASDKDGTVVDFTGNEGARVLEGVAAGAVNASSLQAVNGAQLHGVSQSVATSLGGGSVVNTEGTLTAPVYTLTGADGNATTATGVGNAISQLDTRVAGNTTNLNTLQTTVEGNTTTINSHTTAITNLDSRVTTVETNITNGLNNGEVGLVRQDATSKRITVASDKDGTVVDFTGNEGARTLTGVKAGGADADAVNVAQLKGVVAGLGGDASVNTDGSITGPSYRVDKDADGTGGTTVHNVGDAITNIDARTTTNTTAITNLSESLANGEIGLVQQDEDSRVITVAKGKDGATVNFNGTAGARVLEGVAAGAVNASSRQAINGSQLYAVSQSIANNLGGGSAVNANGTITAPSYSVGGTTVNTVGDAIGNLDGRTSQNSSDIASLKNGMDGMGGNLADITNQITNVSNDVGGLDNRVTHLENAITSGGFSDSGLVSANVDDGARKVASTAGSDALAVGNASEAAGNNSTALGNSSKATGKNSVALGNGSVADRDNAVSVGSQGSERQVANVAAGTQDTDAVNMAQLKQSVRYDQNADGSTNYNQVTLGQGTPVTMSNVASGRVAAGSTDAINGSQMYDWTLNRDNKFSNASLSNRIDGLERDMQAGVATALAARQAPYVPGKTTYAVGAAGYKSQGAVGISTRYTAGTGRWSLEGGFSKSGDGTGVYMGVSGVLGD
ncbi:ESPR-type extended signal peptide-containing protein [Stenotrophomonas sp. PD6]|uniref:ESPR-type extended signal peptide-containing protein n=1 Tax=Stenotrophomonas sp. PD6 TaxID=3368612 RepID=UPI003BA2BAFF